MPVFFTDDSRIAPLVALRMALLPFASPPSFATLVQRGSSDMISFYETVKAMAEIFSLAYGDEYHQKLMQSL